MQQMMPQNGKQSKHTIKPIPWLIRPKSLSKKNGDKLSAENKAKVEAAVSKLKDAIKNDNVDGMKSAMEEVNREMQAVSQELYSQAQPQGQPDPSAGAQQDAGEPQAEESRRQL